MDMKLALLLAFFCSKVNSFTTAREPECSTFDFQEKLLEKMVVLQHNLNSMERQLENKIEEMNTIAAKLKKDKVKLEISIVEDKIKMEDSIQEIADNLQKEVNNTLGVLDQTVTDMENKQKERLEMIEKIKEKMEDEHKKKLLAVDEAINHTETNADRVTNELHMQLNDSLKEFEGKLYKPNVVFYAKGVTGQGSPPMSTTMSPPGEMLVFTSTLFNTDDVYNTTTGLFTAPFAGNYWFSTSVCHVYGSYPNLAIYVNNKEFSTPREEMNNKCMSVNTIAVLKAGDHVHVVRKERGSHYGPTTGMSGWFNGAII